MTRNVIFSFPVFALDSVQCVPLSNRTISISVNLDVLVTVLFCGLGEPVMSSKPSFGEHRHVLVIILQLATIDTSGSNISNRNSPEICT